MGVSPSRTPSASARRLLAGRRPDFDVVHDNQCLGTGLLDLLDDGWPLLTTVHHPITIDRELDLAHASSHWQRFTRRRWYGFLGMQQRVARRMPRVITVSESSRRDLVTHMGLAADRLHVVPVGVDPALFHPLPDVRRQPGRLMTTASADVPMKGLVQLLEALAKLRTERHDLELVVIGRPRDGSAIPGAIDRLGLAGTVRFVSEVTPEEIVALYAEAEIAVVPSLYEGFSLPAVEAMACGVPVVATTGGALPEVLGPDGGAALLVPPNDAEALAGGLRRLLDDEALRVQLGTRGRAPRVRALHLAHDGLAHGRAVPRVARLPSADSPTHSMLTVDLDRASVGAHERVLDLGCGGGRHAFAALRRAAVVVALDADRAHPLEVSHAMREMVESGEVLPSTTSGAVRGDALDLPFAPATFDCVVASEVLEHVTRDDDALAELVRVLRPGGRLAVSVPASFPERICWALDAGYHDTPGGHVRIYRRAELLEKLRHAGLNVYASHRAHALHAPYWWLRCALGVRRENAWLVRRYRAVLERQIVRGSRLLDGLDHALDPVLGKSLVVYATKPA